ncbi:low affinity iron permease family protein [Epilithonimonas mollis]|uniref:Low affinity Fe/Cu permease n=1 Tax=Epilithonimonas mollis TaxID=216903 RepID=A0A1M6TDH3_9FLAO|nr:low affinity iron permease family protein [Epilithonimonas mollis]SHK55082.1 Low affinity Fe/Cu permease [Epilithonimonas mollis]
MEQNKNKFEWLADKITQWSGSSFAFGFAAGVIVLWLICGPVFNYSDTWQLIINTTTTIITFLMVFVIQKSQNKDSKAIQLKLNELIAASKEASNRLVDVEDMNEEDIDTLHTFYEKISSECENEEDIHTSHSIDRADENIEAKKSAKKQ